MKRYTNRKTTSQGYGYMSDIRCGEGSYSLGRKWEMDTRKYAGMDTYTGNSSSYSSWY